MAISELVGDEVFGGGGGNPDFTVHTSKITQGLDTK